MLISEILEKAADLIEPEGAWTRHAGARDALGREVGSFTPEATCWCLITSVEKAALGLPGDLGCDARTFLRKLLRTSYLAQWNDAPERTQPQVVSKLREAAAKAREIGQ